MRLYSKLLSVVVFVLLAQIVSADTRLWVSNSSSNGDYGGRAGLDAHCDADLNKPNVSGSTTRAFISVDASDEIRDMPNNYNVPTNEVIYRSNGSTQIAPDFATLLDAVSVNLINPVTSDAMAIEVYTGSTSTGAISGTTCNGWTDIFAGSAVLGDPKQNTELFLDDSIISCLSDHSVYCITYTSPSSAVNATPLPANSTLGQVVLFLLFVGFGGYFIFKQKSN